MVNWLLKVEHLTKIYGKGCPQCKDLTGPEWETNTCPRCHSLVACADVSFILYPGEILGIVGESGAGKTTVIRCIGLDNDLSEGSVYLGPFQKGEVDIARLDGRQKRQVRTHMVSIVYQNPHHGLDFDVTCGGNIAEKLLNAGFLHVRKIRNVATDLLARTEVPIRRLDDSPSEFSNGMQQRVQIAKSLANNPPLVLLDEISTGLDLSVQARVLDMVKAIARDLRIAMVVISHDLGVIRLLAKRTIVMQLGRIVESGLTDQIMEDAQHEYTQLLVSSGL